MVNEQEESLRAQKKGILDRSLTHMKKTGIPISVNKTKLDNSSRKLQEYDPFVSFTTEDSKFCSNYIKQ